MSKGGSGKGKKLPLYSVGTMIKADSEIIAVVITIIITDLVQFIANKQKGLSQGKYILQTEKRESSYMSSYDPSPNINLILLASLGHPRKVMFLFNHVLFVRELIFGFFKGCVRLFSKRNQVSSNEH